MSCTSPAPPDDNDAGFQAFPRTGPLAALCHESFPTLPAVSKPLFIVITIRSMDFCSSG
jgi:hypothetical protein